MTSLRLAPAAAVLLCLAAWFAIAPAVAAGPVRATATVDGRDIAGANARDPVRLEPSTVALVVVEVTNESADPVTVRRVDLTGHVLGLNFFSYSTSVELTVAAGATGKLTYRLDPAGLGGQATGLIGSDITVIGADGEPVATVPTVVDVRGSLVSVYGLFGIILTVLTLLAIADAALSVARHRLAANRWQRGLRVLAPGIGLGLMIGFTASIARWWVPATSLWLALAGVTATIFFLAGYFSPTPRRPDYLGLDAEDLAAARELDAQGFTADASGRDSATVSGRDSSPASVRDSAPAFGRNQAAAGGYDARGYAAGGHDGGGYDARFASVGAGFASGPRADDGRETELLGGGQGRVAPGTEAGFADGPLPGGSEESSPGRSGGPIPAEFDNAPVARPLAWSTEPGVGPGGGPPAPPRRWGWQPAPNDEPTQVVSSRPVLPKPAAEQLDSAAPTGTAAFDPRKPAVVRPDSFDETGETTVGRSERQPDAAASAARDAGRTPDTGDEPTQVVGQPLDVRKPAVVQPDSFGAEGETTIGRSDQHGYAGDPAHLGDHGSNARGVARAAGPGDESVGRDASNATDPADEPTIRTSPRIQRFRPGGVAG
ncbi:hypothetical protein ABZ319_30265 [Nocardia sp. NPDC005978]|uniref:hypothetical protein n=1 Tax=Nocardia sp. NPDC005978 TaxID=3156725 RepID=UPI0033BA3165